MARWLEYLWGVSTLSGLYLSKAVQYSDNGELVTVSLMQMEHKDWPRWCDPTDELPLLRLFKWLMLTLNTDGCYTWGRMTVEQSGCPCWCPSLKTPTMGTWASELHTEQRKKMVWARGWPGVQTSLTQKHLACQRGQWDALGIVLLGSTRMLLWDVPHLSTVGDHVHPLMEAIFLYCCVQQDYLPWYKRGKNGSGMI